MSDPEMPKEKPLWTKMPGERSQHLDIESAIQQLKLYGFGAINIKKKKVAVVEQKGTEIVLKWTWSLQVRLGQIFATLY